MRNCSFKYPSEALLHERLLTAEDFEIALPKSLLDRVRKIDPHPVPERIGLAVLYAVKEPEWEYGALLPFFQGATNPQVYALMGRLAAEGIEPYLASLVPPWQPGDDGVPKASYEAVRDLVQKNENWYAELSSRYLVRHHTRELALMLARPVKGVPPRQPVYPHNKYVADTLKEYLPSVCTAWRYAETVLAADVKRIGYGEVRKPTDWKALQEKYGVFRIPS